MSVEMLAMIRERKAKRKAMEQTEEGRRELAAIRIQSVVRGRQVRKTRKWEVKIEEPYSYDFDFSSSPVPDIFNVDWENMEGWKKSDGGHQPVFFVKIGESSDTHGALVIKSSQELAAEVFSAKIVAKLGVPGPAIRIIDTRSQEGKKIVQVMESLEGSVTSHANYAFRSTRYILCMEFLSGRTLLEQRALTFERYMENDMQAILHELGRLAAIDVLLNNTDRVPLVASNQGNAGNVMFSNDTGHLISLDNGMQAISAQASFKDYLDRVIPILEAIKESPATPHSNTQRLQTLIHNFTGYDIGDEGVFMIQDGVNEMIQLCHETLNIEELKKMKQELIDTCGGHPSLDAIQIPFLQVMLAMFEQVRLGNKVTGQTLLSQSIDV